MELCDCCGMNERSMTFGKYYVCQSCDGYYTEEELIEMIRMKEKNKYYREFVERNNFKVTFNYYYDNSPHNIRSGEKEIYADSTDQAMMKVTNSYPNAYNIQFKD